MFFRSALASMALAGLSQATIAPTFPVSGDVCHGTSECSLQWIDDGAEPSADRFGATRVGLFVGTVNDQVEIQDLGMVADPVNEQNLRPRIDPSVGSNGDFYFIRFESTEAQGDNGYPLQAFSARFSLADMTGELSSDAQAAIDDANAASASSQEAPSEEETSSSSSESESASESDSASGSEPTDNLMRPNNAAAAATEEDDEDSGALSVASSVKTAASLAVAAAGAMLVMA